MTRKSSAVYFGASLPACARNASVYFSLQHHRQITGIELARRNLGCTDIRRRFDRRDTTHGVLRRTDPGPGPAVGPDGLHRETVSQRDVVTDLVQLRLGQLEARRVGATSMAEVNEPGAFVDREKVFHAVAQALRDIGCIIRKGF
jgi:hypothetical protein